MSLVGLNYPEGVFLLVGVTLVITTNHLLPQLGYTNEAILDPLYVLGIGLALIGLAYTIFADDDESNTD